MQPPVHCTHFTWMFVVPCVLLSCVFFCLIKNYIYIIIDIILFDQIRRNETKTKTKQNILARKIGQYLICERASNK